ncbi:MAG: GDSL-type esterase/lipase family protein [Fimbriimonas sp.]|nr:GDSL-type esterase/lipase family protein [Fimbriimonas sp.]
MIRTPIGRVPGHTIADSSDLGVLLGDSVVRGFGGSPVYYNDQGPIFHRAAYRFVASADRPVRCLDGYEGIHTWLNRGVTANGTNATLARWSIDVTSRLTRGAQTKGSRVTSVLVSTGFMDVAQGVLRHHLPAAEIKLKKNLLLLVRRAKADRVRIAFLEIPDPTKAPLGKRFHTKAGTPVVPFYEEQKLNPAMRREFTEAVQRYRTFLETTLAAEGAEIIDYASFLPTGYFWDSHHPSDPGYAKLGQLLAKRYPGPVGKG